MLLHLAQFASIKPFTLNPAQQPIFPFTTMRFASLIVILASTLAVVSAFPSVSKVVHTPRPLLRFVYQWYLILTSLTDNRSQHPGGARTGTLCVYQLAPGGGS